MISVSSARSFYVGETDDFDEEIKLTRANKALMKFLDMRGRVASAKKERLIPIKEVERNLGLKRRNRS